MGGLRRRISPGESAYGGLLSEQLGGFAAVSHPESPPTAASCRNNWAASPPYLTRRVRLRRPLGRTIGRLRRRISPGESAYGGLLEEQLGGFAAVSHPVSPPTAASWNILSPPMDRKLARRNIVTGLAAAGIAVLMFGLTFLAVS